MNFELKIQKKKWFFFLKKKTDFPAFETLEEYFSISADFEKNEELRAEEEQLEIETEHWERELEEMIDVIKREFSIENVRRKLEKNLKI